MNYNTFNKEVRRITEQYGVLETLIIYEIVKLLATIDTDKPIDEVIDDLIALQFYNLAIGRLIRESMYEPVRAIKPILEEVGKSFIDTETLTKAYELDKIKVDPSKIDYKPIIEEETNKIYQDIDYMQGQVRQGVFKRTSNFVNQARLEIELGYKSPQQAIVDVTKELASKGIPGDEYIRQDGVIVRQSLEGVARRLVRTSFIRTASKMNEELGERLGTKHWYMSQHMGARTTGTGLTNHAEWQGKVYTTEELTTVCGKGHDQGYLGYNCRHIARPHIKGVSVEPPKALDMKEMERVYDLEQQQRTLERRIRATKREIEALRLIDTEESNDAIHGLNKRLRKQQATLREYIKANDDVLRRDYSREKIIKSN